MFVNVSKAVRLAHGILVLVHPCSSYLPLWEGVLITPQLFGIKNCFAPRFQSFLKGGPRTLADQGAVTTYFSLMRFHCVKFELVQFFVLCSNGFRVYFSGSMTSHDLRVGWESNRNPSESMADVFIIFQDASCKRLPKGTETLANCQNREGSVGKGIIWWKLQTFLLELQEIIGSSAKLKTSCEDYLKLKGSSSVKFPCPPPLCHWTGLSSTIQLGPGHVSIFHR